MATRRALLRSVGFAVLVAGAMLLGRATRLPGEQVALVWPAAGIGIWWLWSARGRRDVTVAVVLLPLVTTVVNLVTAAPPVPSAVFGLINLAHAVVGALVLRRLLPGGGLRAPRDVGSLLVASAAAAGVSGPASAALAWAALGAQGWDPVVLFALRNLGSSFAVLVVVLSLTRPHSWRALVARRGAVTAAAAALVTLTVFVYLFGSPQALAVLFLALALPVWFGTTLGVERSAVVTAAACVVAVSATVLGSGVFAGVGEPVAAAALVQAFVVVLLLTSQSLATLQHAHDGVAAELARSHDQLQELIDGALIGKAVVSPAEGGRWALGRTNPALRRLLAAPTPEGGDWLRLVCPDDRDALRAALDRVGAGGETWTGEVQHCLPDGSRVWTQVHLSALPRSPAPAVIAQVLDVRARKEAEAQLSRLALHDPLTGLANRVLLRDRVEHALGTAARTGLTVGMVFLDLDGFKAVNDTLGHDAGDEVLRAVAERLATTVRPEDTVARVGGDEFVVCCPGVVDGHLLRVVAERLHTAVALPVAVGQHLVPVGASVGVALSRPGDDVSSLLRRSDAAMYAVKRTGRGGVAVHPGPAAPLAPPAG